MTEPNLLLQLQNQLQTLNTTFAKSSVVVNDWRILDSSNTKAPYIIIEGSSEFHVEDLQIGMNEIHRDVPVTIIVKFKDWKESLDQLVAIRQLIITMFSSMSSYAVSNESLNFAISGLKNEGPITGIYDHYLAEEREALPIFLAQTILVQLVEYMMIE